MIGLWLGIKSTINISKVNRSNKLLKCKKNDVIDINVEDSVDFYVENQLYFSAEMGELKGNAAVNLKKRLV